MSMVMVMAQVKVMRQQIATDGLATPATDRVEQRAAGTWVFGFAGTTLMLYCYTTKQQTHKQTNGYNFYRRN